MNLKTNNKRAEKGITLIALVVTIVVLLILAGVSINAIFGQDGIIQKAKDAQNKMDQATQNDLNAINELNDWLYEITGKSKPVTNPYVDQQWTMAYVCNNGTWSNTPLTAANGDTIPEGSQIVAKFYATGEKITPSSLKLANTTIPFSEGETYKVVIEGTGEMGILMDATDISDIKSASGWQIQTVSYLAWLQGGMQGDTVSIITPYITELTICDGITNVGNFAMAGATSLSKVTLGNSLKTIGNFSFSFNNELSEISIPDTVTSVGENAFWRLYGNITSIIVPNEAIAKIVNGSYHGGTAKVVIANENKIAQNTINAEEVANHPVVYCGKEVTGYTCDNSAGVNKWKIYHSDGKNIYLIADNYITAEYIPTKDGATMTASTGYTNAYYFEDTLLNKYTGAASITDTNITPWLSYLKSSYGGSDNKNKNMKATAYLLDTEIWKGFKNLTKAEYAIGAPTLDMFVASYNTRFAKQIETIVQETGYKLKFTDGDSYKYYLLTCDYLTAHHYKDNYANYMWLASPSADGSDFLMYVDYYGNVDSCGYDDSCFGVRPLVCLESGVSLEKQEVNGEIVYNIK